MDKLTTSQKWPLWPRRPGVQEEECGHQVEGGSTPPLLCPSEAPSGILYPVLGSPVRVRQGTAGESSVEGYSDY